MSKAKSSLDGNRGEQNSGPIDWDHIDWADVAAKLGRRASFITAVATDCYGWRISAEELLQDTFVAILASPTHLGWTPEQGSIEAFLCGVMKNKLRDQKKKKNGWEASLDDPNFHPPADRSTANFIELFSQLRADARGNRRFESLIDAALQINASGNLNQQMSDIMNSESPGQVANDRRRFQRRVNRNG